MSSFLFEKITKLFKKSTLKRAVLKNTVDSSRCLSATFLVLASWAPPSIAAEELGERSSLRDLQVAFEQMRDRVFSESGPDHYTVMGEMIRQIDLKPNHPSHQKFFEKYAQSFPMWSLVFSPDTALVWPSSQIFCSTMGLASAEAQDFVLEGLALMVSDAEDTALSAYDIFDNFFSRMPCFQESPLAAPSIAEKGLSPPTPASPFSVSERLVEQWIREDAPMTLAKLFFISLAGGYHYDPSPSLISTLGEYLRPRKAQFEEFMKSAEGPLVQVGVAMTYRRVFFGLEKRPFEKAEAIQFLKRLEEAELSAPLARNLVRIFAVFFEDMTWDQEMLDALGATVTVMGHRGEDEVTAGLFITLAETKPQLFHQNRWLTQALIQQLEKGYEIGEVARQQYYYALQLASGAKGAPWSSLFEIFPDPLDLISRSSTPHETHIELSYLGEDLGDSGYLSFQLTVFKAPHLPSDVRAAALGKIISKDLSVIAEQSEGALLFSAMESAVKEGTLPVRLGRRVEKLLTQLHNQGLYNYPGPLQYGPDPNVLFSEFEENGTLKPEWADQIQFHLDHSKVSKHEGLMLNFMKLGIQSTSEASREALLAISEAFYDSETSLGGRFFIYDNLKSWNSDRPPGAKIDTQVAAFAEKIIQDILDESIDLDQRTWTLEDFLQSSEGENESIKNLIGQLEQAQSPLLSRVRLRVRPPGEGNSGEDLGRRFDDSGVADISMTPALWQELSGSSPSLEQLWAIVQNSRLPADDRAALAESFCRLPSLNDQDEPEILAEMIDGVGNPFVPTQLRLTYLRCLEETVINQ